MGVIYIMNITHIPTHLPTHLPTCTSPYISPRTSPPPMLLPTQYVSEAKKCYSELRDSGSHPTATVFVELIRAVLKEGDIATAESLRR